MIGSEDPARVGEVTTEPLPRSIAVVGPRIIQSAADARHGIVRSGLHALRGTRHHRLMPYLGRLSVDRGVGSRKQGGKKRTRIEKVVRTEIPTGGQVVIRSASRSAGAVSADTSSVRSPACAAPGRSRPISANATSATPGMTNIHVNERKSGRLATDS